MPADYLKNIHTGRVFPATDCLRREAARYGRLVPCDDEGNLIDNPQQAPQGALPGQASDVEVPYYRPDQKVVSGLMERYPFQDTFDLHSRLSNAYIDREAYVLLVEQANPTGKMKTHLRKLRDSCESLHKALDNISMNERELLRKYWALGGSLQRMKTDTAIAREIADNALNDLNNQKSSRKGDLPFRGFVKELRDIWKDGTGQEEPKALHDRTNDAFKGPFFEFVIECLDLANIRYHSKGAVGKALQRVLKNEDT